MKKILLFLTVAFLSAASLNAQDSNWYVGGNAGFKVYASSAGNIGWNISPQGGYRFNDRMAAGLCLNLAGTSVWTGSDSSVSTVFNFDVVPYFRWSFANVKDLRFFLDGSVALGVQNNAVVSAGSTLGSASAFHWGIAVAPGIAYDITGNWSVITHFASLGVEGAGSSAVFSFTAIQGPNVGVEYRF